MNESRERVARGAAWLDEVAPGWERKLDLSVLDIADPDRCVCGQVFMQPAIESNYTSGYSYARFEHSLVLVSMARSGFVYDEDGDAWVELVKQRFDAGTLSDEPTSG